MVSRNISSAPNSGCPFLRIGTRGAAGSAGAFASRRRLTSRGGLTLIEVIVVIALLTVLCTMAVALGQHVIQASNRKATEALLDSLASAADRHRIERGYWPWEELTGAWEIELTRIREPNCAVRMPCYSAGMPHLLEKDLDTASGGYTRVVDNWGNPVRLNLPGSPLGLANQGAPIFQSAGPDGRFSEFDAGNLFAGTDDVFSHCGTDQ